MRQRTWTIGAFAATLVIALVPMGRMGGLLAQQAAQESEEGFRNLQILDPNITKDDLDPVTITCWTCHRGEAEPKPFTPEDDDDWI